MGMLLQLHGYWAGFGGGHIFQLVHFLSLMLSNDRAVVPGDASQVGLAGALATSVDPESVANANAVNLAGSIALGLEAGMQLIEWKLFKVPYTCKDLMSTFGMSTWQQGEDAS